MDREKLTEQILAYLDGQLSEDEERALAAAIRGDEESEKLLADLVRLHGSVASVLQERAGESAAQRELDATPTPPGGVPRVRRRFRAHRPAARPASIVWILSVGGALAACLLIVIAAAVSGGRPADRPATARPVRKAELPEAPPLPPLPETPLPKPATPPVEPKNPLPPPSDPVPPPAPGKVEEAVPPAPAPRPKPEEPRPAPAAPPKTTVAEAAPKPPPAVVQIERVKGEVYRVAAGARAPAREGEGLLPGQSLQTSGAESLAVVKFTDGTQLELAGDTTVSQLAEAASKIGSSTGLGAGKKIVLDSGAVAATVSKQPAGQPMIFTTAHAEARVLGTALKLSIDPQGTRLEVTEGRVRLTRRQDGASAEVGAGFYAVASAAHRPAARKIGTPLPGTYHLFETFEDAAAVKARWQPLEGGFPTTSAGGIEVDLSPRPGDSYAAAGWHFAGGLRTRQSFPLPLRVTVEVEVSHQDVAMNALLVLIPVSQKGGTVKNEIAMRVRGGEHALLIENEKAKVAEGSSKVPLRERWTLEVNETDVRVLIDDREFHRQAHKLTITENYRVELQGAAKIEAPKGAKVRFDNAKIEP